MPGLCPNSWQTYGCEWSIGYLWHWMSWLGRVDVVVLALMLTHIVVVVGRVCYRYHLVRRSQVVDTNSQAFQGNRRKLAIDLSVWVGSLKSIPSIAPLLGLVGTCGGILSAFSGIGMETHGVLVVISSEVAASLITTLTGLLVAIPAIWSYNYLCTLLNLLESETSDKALEAVTPGERKIQCFQFARALPLRKRFSEMPPFGLMAATSLAILVVVFVTPSHTSSGLHIDIPQSGGVASRKRFSGEPIVIRVAGMSGNGSTAIYVNSKKTPLHELDNTVRSELKVRLQQTANVEAESDVSWADVANVIDIIEGIQALHANVVLLVPLDRRGPQCLRRSIYPHTSQTSDAGQ